MADEQSYGDRTEAPTPKKRQEARNKGQIPRSQELTTAVLLLASAVVLTKGTGGLARAIASLFGESATAMGSMGSPQETAVWLRQVAQMSLSAIAPILVGMAGVALVVAGVQAQGVVTFEPLKPNWERLSPQKNIKEKWGVQAPVQLAKSLAKLGIIAGAMYFSLRGAQDQLPDLARTGPMALLLFVRDQAARLILSAGLAYLILAVADYGYQLWRHEKSLKMSKEEIRKEVKETEGDQILKVRRRTMARSMARRRMLLSVSDADVVVTNPTHIAVALKYDPEVSPAPMVLAMGVRKVAHQIKKIAMDSGVPMVENKPLARALYKTARVGFPIPVELYVAVAEILAWVIRQRRKMKMAWNGSGLA
jgi:flagellar biosynthetic protein FlhB